MKTKHLLLLLALSACKKEQSAINQIPKYNPPHGKLVATVTHSMNGVIYSVDNYYYDNYNRPLNRKTTTSSTSSYSESFTFTGNTISIRRFNDNTALPTFTWLIENDLAKSFIQTNIRGDKRKYNELQQLIQLNNYTVTNGYIDSTVYSYNSNGNCTLKVTYSNGLINYYSYIFNDTVNTLSDNNYGIYWTGRQNANLVTSQIIRSDYSGYLDSTFYNYSYELNPDGTVKKLVNQQVHNGAISENTEEYTYYNN